MCVHEKKRFEQYSNPTSVVRVLCRYTRTTVICPRSPRNRVAKSTQVLSKSRSIPPLWEPDTELVASDLEDVIDLGPKLSATATPTTTSREDGQGENGENRDAYSTSIQQSNA